MSLIKFNKSLFFILIFFSFPLSVSAFSSPNVPIDDPIYRDIDKLAAFGFVKYIIYGQRPWSRGEIARIIWKAHQANRGENHPASNLIKKLLVEYHDEMVDSGFIMENIPRFRLYPIKYVRLENTFLDSPFRPVPSHGLGLMDAVTNPLISYREGRNYFHGNVLSLETEHAGQAFRFFSFYVRPRLQVGVTSDGNGKGNAYIQQLYTKLAYKNTELEIGRDSVAWGQGQWGGVLLSNNARPFDMIKLSNLSSATHPWPFRYTLFTANLGPEREFPYSYLTGLKFSWKPTPFIELGLDQILVWGGDGAPGPLTPGTIFQEFFFWRPGDSNLSNRELGFDIRLWFPFLRNTQIYLDTQVEDKEIGSFAFMFKDLSIIQTGIYFPLLDRSGKTDLRLEYKQGSPYMYSHSHFITGMALNKRLWGDELGPLAKGFYMTLSKSFLTKINGSFAFQFERRDSDIIGQREDDQSRNREIFVVEDRPIEDRWAGIVKLDYEWKKNMRLSGNFGYERVQGFNFNPGDNRDNFLIQTGIKYLF